MLTIQLTEYDRDFNPLPFTEPGLRFEGELEDNGVQALVFEHQLKTHYRRLEEILGPFTDAQKIRDFGYRLGRNPKLWYNGVLKLAAAKEIGLTFRDLLQLFGRRYHPDNYHELLKAYTEDVHQGRRPTKDYIEEFLSIYRQVGGLALDPDLVLKRFVSGLHPRLRLPLERGLETHDFDDIDDLIDIVLRRFATSTF